MAIKRVENPLNEVKKKILTEIKLLREIQNIKKAIKSSDEQNRKKLETHLKSLELYLKKIVNEIISSMEEIKLNPSLPNYQQQIMALPMQQPIYQPPMQYVSKYPTKKEDASKKAKEKDDSPGFSLREIEDEGENEEDKEEIESIEKEALKRLKKKEGKKTEEKAKKTSRYVRNASNMFADTARKLMAKGFFKKLEKDLIKSNLEFVPASYIALIFYTSMLAIAVGVLIAIFFLFFNIGAELPIITMVKESISVRFLKVFWILFVVPAGTFAAMYVYPSLEKKSVELKINQELPFATIHMAAISGSMIDPTKIFKIIIDTGEYPSVGKEFTKLLNQINVYGYDLVGGLRNMAFNNPSRKLADLFNSMATAISSGGDLPDFFDKRANSLLFEHRLEKEKQAKAAETFMDIYISVVIAAPMILMLMLLMMKIGGLGISMSTGAITITMILGVTVINIFFLTFLHLRQPGE